MTSQTGKQSVTIVILSDISRSKDNQKMKFGQLFQDDQIFFFEKSCTKSGGEPIPRIKTEHISRSTAWDLKQFVFNDAQVEDYQNILKLRSWTDFELSQW